MRPARITFPPRRGGGASGGASLSDPNVAYVRSDGNDSTGEIGNPGKPYRTMQAAYTAGARNFDLGIGDFGTLTLAAASNDKIRYIGRGAPTEQEPTLGWSSGSIFEVDATAAHSARFSDIGFRSAFIKTATARNCIFYFFSCRVGPTSTSPLSADDGQDGGTVFARNSLIQSIECVGNNGAPGTGEDPGGTGGGATVQLEDCRVIDTLICQAGLGGIDGGQGAGSNGQGQCLLTRCDVDTLNAERCDGEVNYSKIQTVNVAGGTWINLWNKWTDTSNYVPDASDDWWTYPDWP